MYASKADVRTDDSDNDDDEKSSRAQEQQWLKTIRKKDEINRNLQATVDKHRSKTSELQTLISEKTALHDARTKEKMDVEQQLKDVKKDHEDELHMHRKHSDALLAQTHRRETDLAGKHEELLGDMKKLHSIAEEAHAQHHAARARCEALEAENAELKQMHDKADGVRQSLLHHADERATRLEKQEQELRECRALERSGREHHQAAHERLNAQCESSARQVQDKAREADVLDERVKRLEEALRVKGLTEEKLRTDAQEVRRDLQSKLETLQEEFNNKQNSLSARDAVESALRERIAMLDHQIEEHKTVEQKLRQDLHRETSDKEDKELALSLAKRREEQLAKTIASMEEQLSAARTRGDDRETTLASLREKHQVVELELHGAKESAEMHKGETARVRSTEEAVRKETLWRSDERVAQRDGEISQLQNQLAERREDVTQRSAALDNAMISHANQRSELHAQLHKSEADLESHKAVHTILRSDLSATQQAHQDAKSDLEKHRRDLEQRGKDVQCAEKKTQAKHNEASELKEELEAAKKDAEIAWDRLRERQSPPATEKEVNTSPRLLDGAAAMPKAARYGNEIAALHRSVEALHAVQAVQGGQAHFHALPRGLELQVPLQSATRPEALALLSRQASKTSAIDAPPLVSRQGSKTSVIGVRSGARRTSVTEAAMFAVPPGNPYDSWCVFVDQKMAWFRRRMLLTDVWSIWIVHFRTASGQARLDLAMADDHLLAMQRRACEAGRSVKGELSRPLPELTAQALKSLVLEFRHRTSAAIADLLPLAGCPREARAVLISALVTARRSFGRILHASFFLYQKLRTLIPSELREPLQDPLAQVIPVPFYVLPYKARHAVEKGAAAIARGGAPVTSKQRKAAAMPSTADEVVNWLSDQIEELEETMPLAGSSVAEVPNFIARLLIVRAHAMELLGVDAGGKRRAEAASLEPEDVTLSAQVRDHLDVLLSDALTVFMSSWRSEAAPELRSGWPQGPNAAAAAAAKARNTSCSAAERAVARAAMPFEPQGPPHREMQLGRPAHEYLS